LQAKKGNRETQKRRRRKERRGFTFGNNSPSTFARQKRWEYDKKPKRGEGEETREGESNSPVKKSRTLQYRTDPAFHFVEPLIKGPAEAQGDLGGSDSWDNQEVADETLYTGSACKNLGGYGGGGLFTKTENRPYRIGKK